MFNTVSPAAYASDDHALVLENRTVLDVPKLLFPGRPSRSIARSGITCFMKYYQVYDVM